jgi:hypothetical protein
VIICLGGGFCDLSGLSGFVVLVCLVGVYMGFVWFCVFVLEDVNRKYESANCTVLQ